MNRMTLLAATTMFAVSTIAPAQEPPPSSRDRARDAYRVFTWNDNRGRIGVIVSTEADASTDRLGARIEGVTPGGPAERAGMKAGDIITKFNTTALGGAKAEEADESGPGMKLLELARALEPGDSVRLEYRRGNDTKTATIVAADIGWRGLARMPGGVWAGPLVPDIEVAPKLRYAPEADDAMRRIEVELAGLASPWGGVELVTLDRDLGEYFGVSDGLLVVKVRSDSAMPLKSGDVILAIDGRKPTSPSHALRILRSYEAGERVSLEIQRKQRKETVTWTVPERERVRVRTPRAAPRAPRPERSEEG